MSEQDQERWRNFAIEGRNKLAKAVRKLEDEAPKFFDNQPYPRQEEIDDLWAALEDIERFTGNAGFYPPVSDIRYNVN